MSTHQLSFSVALRRRISSSSPENATLNPQGWSGRMASSVPLCLEAGGKVLNCKHSQWWKAIGFNMLNLTTNVFASLKPEKKFIKPKQHFTHVRIHLPLAATSFLPYLCDLYLLGQIIKGERALIRRQALLETVGCFFRREVLEEVRVVVLGIFIGEGLFGVF